MRNWKVLVALAGSVTVMATGCGKKEEAAPEAAKVAAPAPAAAAAEGAKAEGGKAAEPAPAPAPEAPKGPTPEQIAEMTTKSTSEKIDDQIAALRTALRLVQTMELDDTKEKFKPDQAGQAEATSAINAVASLVTKPTLADADKAKVKSDVVPALTEAARLGSAPVKSLLASGTACTALVSDPASIAAIDKALGESVVDKGWTDLFDCVMTRGPTEHAYTVEKKAEYDRWTTLDRQIAVFSAQKNPKAHSHVLGTWIGMQTKNAKIGPAIVGVYGTLDNNAKGYAHTVLTNQCDKDSGGKVVAELKKAPAGSAEALWAKGLETGLAGCK